MRQSTAQLKAMLKETVDTDVPSTVLNLHDDVVLSRKKVIRTPIFERRVFAFDFVKILGNPSGLPAFFPCAIKNPLSQNSST
ncbi:MAG: hypothetical protein L6V93_14665 [Clostridiales bacterium]|nr:MAG: hypothetical protein L6V93_14665 [Clostridiales bacterium]